MQKKQSKEVIHHFLWAGRCSASLHHTMVTWEDKCHHYLYPSYPSFICTAQNHMVRNVPLVSWSWLSWLCPPPYSLYTTSLLTGAVGWNRKVLEAMQVLLSNNREDPCIISTIPCWFTNPKHNTVWATMKKKTTKKVCKWHQQEPLGDIQTFTLFESWFYRKQISYFQYCFNSSFLWSPRLYS